MLNQFIYLLFITILTPIDGKWKLVWSEEFNEFDSLHLIDVRKWKTSTIEEECDGDKPCYSDAPYKLHLVDGTLALRGLAHKHLPDQIVTQKVQARYFFTKGKLEIRAALSLEEGLWPTIILTNRGPLINDSVRNITFKYFDPGLNSTNTHSFESVTEFEQDKTFILKDLIRVPKLASSMRFQKFSIEWNTFEILMRIDDKMSYHKINSNMIKDEDIFELSLAIYVGGEFLGFKLDKHDVSKLVCPAFVVDYVRYYQFFDESNERESNLVKESPMNEKIELSNVCSMVKTSTEKLTYYHKVAMISFISTWIILLSIFQFKLLIK